ncbi:MAG: molybdopterin molybdotransferase MoeA [Geodermatophilaceae bacterium]|nr:molybdopterin molybdotransferase MoeA [Geodermatophilaceae bacterium]
MAEPGSSARTVEDYLDAVLALMPHPDPIEVALLDAQGLLCAEEVISDISLPPNDHAAADGYAVRNSDIRGASDAEPTTLPVVGEAGLGDHESSSIGVGMALRVTAGTLMPSGADLVVPLSWTDRGVARVAIRRELPAGTYVRNQGEDVAPGDVAVTVGTAIGPAQVGLLAAVGRERVLVRPRPRVVIVSAGSDLVDVGTKPGLGQTVDVNSYALAAAARDADAEVYRAGIGRDDKRRLVELLESQVVRSDLIVVSGRFSSDSFDVMQEALAEVGEVNFEAVAIHPGALQGSGKLGTAQTPVLCIPGDPVSALVSFEVFIRPAIRLMAGKRQLFRRTVHAVCQVALDSPAGRRQYRRGQVMRHPDGGYVVTPMGGPGAHLLANMAQSNSLIVVDQDVTQVPVGDTVTVIPMLLGT